MTYEDSLETALVDVDIVFAITDPLHNTRGNDVSQGINMVDAAKATRVRLLVFSSVASTDKDTGIHHLETKYKVKQYSVQSGIPYTIIGLTAFMDNFIQPFMLPNLRQCQNSRALPAWQVLELIAVEDIERFAALVIDRRETFLGKRIDIAGDDLTGDEAAPILSGVVGMGIKHEAFPPYNPSLQYPDLTKVLEGEEENNCTADNEGVPKNYPDVKWHTLEEWAKGSDSKALLGD